MTPLGKINKPRNDFCRLKAKETIIWTFRNLIFFYMIIHSKGYISYFMEDW